jgi:phosphoribosylaminoimidazolecarboxamide formyltransferase/IMP cyclohydrolase
MIERALISVYDKRNLKKLVNGLKKMRVEIISSGGTARRIKNIGYPHLVEVSDYTEYPESPGGLVKTLHPKVHGGILLNPDIQEHREYLKKNEIKPINLVVVNLYPFEETVAGGADLHEAAENIDIGGPTLIRSAAKAALLYDKVTVVVDPSMYDELLGILEENHGEVPSDFRRKLAEKAFKRTAEYERVISEYLEA